MLRLPLAVAVVFLSLEKSLDPEKTGCVAQAVDKGGFAADWGFIESVLALAEEGWTD